MDDFGFDINGLLSDEEADKIFEEQVEEKTLKPDEVEKEKPAEEEEPTEETSPESVGEEENDENEESAITREGDGSSPNIYSSIAKALKNDGIFPDFADEELDAAQTPEAFAELFDKAVMAKMDERQRRIDEALGNGVAPDTVKQYEQALQYLDTLNDEALSAETEAGEDLRKQLIYNDLISRGFSHERAIKELEKSFKAGTDVEDVKDAVASLKEMYSEQYKALQDEAKKMSDAAKAQRAANAAAYKKMILEDDIMIGDRKLDKRICQKIYDVTSKPTYKDENGNMITTLQKYIKENPLEFYKNMGMWYVLTDGGKNTDVFTKQAAKAEKAKAIKELGNKLNTSAINKDGSLRYVSSGTGDGNDPLLSDGWKIGW